MDKSLRLKSSLKPAQQIGLLLACGAVLAIIACASDVLYIGHQRSAFSLYTAEYFLATHKPFYIYSWYDRMPGTVLVNAAAIGIWNSLAAIAAAELLFCTAAGFFLYGTMLNLGTARSSAAVTSGWFALAASATCAIGGANEPAVWALPFSASFVFFLTRYGSFEKSRAFFSGAAAGFATLFLGREAVLILIGLLALRKKRNYFLVGVVLFPALFAIYLLTSAESGHRIDALIRMLSSTLWTYQPLSFNGDKLSALKMAGLLAPLVVLLLPGRSPGPGGIRLKRILLFWTSVEFIFLFFNGPVFPTELLTALVPIIVVLAQKIEIQTDAAGPARHSRVYFALVLICFLSIAAQAATPLFPKSALVYDEKLKGPQIVSKVVSKYSKRYVQVWGDTPLVYVLSKRISPSYYHTFQPLFNKKTDERAVPRFIEDFRRRPPEILVLQTSLLPEGMKDAALDVPALEMGDRQKILFAFLHNEVRKNYKMLTVEHGIIVLMRINP